MAEQKDLTIRQGETYTHELRWGTKPLQYKTITEVSQAAPVRIKAVGHGLTEGWPVAVTNVKGMTDLNAEANNVKASDYKPCTVVDTDYIEINEINAAGFKPYVSGGQLQFNTPVELTGYTARMSVKDKIGGTELLSLTTENGRITVSNTLKTITLELAEADVSAITWKRGVFDLELESPTGKVTTLLYGSVAVTKEVTTN